MKTHNYLDCEAVLRRENWEYKFDFSDALRAKKFIYHGTETIFFEVQISGLEDCGINCVLMKAYKMDSVSTATFSQIGFMTHNLSSKAVKDTQDRLLRMVTQQ